MRKSLIIETLYEVSIVFRKESFINAKKVLNFIQSLTNEKKVINPLTAFHILSPAPKELELMCKFLDTSYQSCLQNTNANGELLGMPRYSIIIIIVHYKLVTTVSGHTIPNNSAFLFCRHDWYCSPNLSSEEQRKVDLNVHFNRNMSKSSSTCTTKTLRVCSRRKRTCLVSDTCFTTKTLLPCMQPYEEDLSSKRYMFWLTFSWLYLPIL